MNKLTLVCCVLFAALASQAIGTEDDLHAIAWCLYTEARGENEIGLRAVASVIYNRAASSHRSYTKVVFAPKQFSGVGAAVPYWFKTGDIPAQADKAARVLCYQISLEMTSNRFRPSGDWTHYYATSMQKAPYWAKGVTNVVTVGRHKFMKL